MKKTLLTIIAPFIWIYNLPSMLRFLNRKIDQLENELKHYEESTDKDFDNLVSAIDKVEGKSNRKEYRLQQVEKSLSAINLSADVCIKSPSWAVVSYKSKRGDVVKFFDIGNKNAMDVERFLSEMPSLNRHIDAPRFMKFKP